MKFFPCDATRSESSLCVAMDFHYQTRFKPTRTCLKSSATTVCGSEIGETGDKFVQFIYELVQLVEYTTECPKSSKKSEFRTVTVRTVSNCY